MFLDCQSDRESFVGNPKKCWCGAKIMVLMSKSDHNQTGDASSVLMLQHKMHNSSELMTLLNEIETLKFKKKMQDLSKSLKRLQQRVLYLRRYK